MQYYIGVLHTFQVGNYTATETLETYVANTLLELDRKVEELRRKYEGKADTRIHVNSIRGIADIPV